MGYSASTNFIVLMSFPIMPTKGVAWDNETALTYLELACRPSSSRDDPVPRGLNRDTSRRINELILAIGATATVDAARRLVDGKSAQHKQGREAYRAWYKSTLSRNVNKRMAAAMAAASVSVVEVIGRQETDDFPQISTFPANDIGPEFIGPVICNGQNLANPASTLIKGLITATLGRLRKHYNKGHEVVFGKRVRGGDRDLESSVWMKAEVLMTSELFFLN